MSRSYEVEIEIEGLKEGEAAKIEAALDESGEGLTAESYAVLFHAYGDTTLSGGCSTDDRAEELARVIFEAVKRPVDITFSWWFKEREPDETNFFSDEEFAEMFPALTQLAMAADEGGQREKEQPKEA
jgi:hypothetical protein